jgi:NAD(P)-dependent dehydrogenase (short-subunit alcohol dehydrogenase family)
MEMRNPIFEKIFDLKDKVGIITGGSSGIGLAIAQTLGYAGVKIAVVNRTEASGKEAVARLGEEGIEAIAVPCDVSRKKDVEAMVEEVEENLGSIDILVNSAGINLRKKALEFDAAEWDQILDINLKGTFLACQIVGRRMVERSSGHIVNISSIAAFIGLSDRAPYCASKGGVSQLTKALAIEWATSGVTVNAIGPGYVRTPLITELLGDSNFQKTVHTQVPMKRIAETEDLQGILLVLCSKAGAYITGQTIYVDGGWSIW